MEQKRAALPLITSGYFDTARDSAFDMNYNIVSRQRDFARYMRDLGMRMVDGTPVIDQRDSAYDYSVIADAKRDSVNSATTRGFAPNSPMAKALFARPLADVKLQAQRAFGDKTFGNTNDRLQRRRLLAAANQTAARFGVDNEMWMPPKVRGGNR